MATLITPHGSKAMTLGTTPCPACDATDHPAYQCRLISTTVTVYVTRQLRLVLAVQWTPDDAVEARLIPEDHTQDLDADAYEIIAGGSEHWAGWRRPRKNARVAPVVTATHTVTEDGDDRLDYDWHTHPPSAEEETFLSRYLVGPSERQQRRDAEEW